MSEKQNACDNCRWWDWTLGDIGKCRINAPRADSDGAAAWPVTSRSSWCGRFEHRDARAARLLGTKYMSQSKDEATGTGIPCPKCSTPMARKAHPPGWKPKPAAPYYFKYWDTCKKCRHIQHYEAAKCHLVDDGPRITKRTSDWQGTPVTNDGDAPWE